MSVEKTKFDYAQLIHARLVRKPEEFDLQYNPFEVTTAYELDQAEWLDFLAYPLKNREWIANAEETVFLVRGPHEGSVLVDTQGSDYARYAARIS